MTEENKKASLFKAVEYLKNKGLDVGNYCIVDIEGGYLSQIPIATWLDEYAAKQVVKALEQIEKSLPSDEDIDKIYHYEERQIVAKYRNKTQEAINKLKKG